MPSCKNVAAYKFTHKSGDKYNSLNLCDECMRELYGQFGKILIPKSPRNMFNERQSATVKEKK